MAFTREQIEEELFYILSESYCFNEDVALHLKSEKIAFEIRKNQSV